MFPKQGDRILLESIPSYRGDEELARLLAEAGAALSLEQTKTLVAGVAAAPSGSDVWTRLVAPDVTGALDSNQQPNHCCLTQAVALDSPLRRFPDWGCEREWGAAARQGLLSRSPVH